jgi:biotin carboxylase
METVSQRVIEQVGLDNSTFSIEFFCDLDTGRVSVLEINARHSQSHAEMFEYVDGVPNHHCMLRLGLGQDPRLPKGEGPYNIAAKWYHRRFTDAVVTRVPTEEEIERLQQEIPGVTIDIVPGEGERLSEMPAQDSYSYELADIFIGAGSEEEMRQKFDRCVEALRFEFDEEAQ